MKRRQRIGAAAALLAALLAGLYWMNKQVHPSKQLIVAKGPVASGSPLLAYMYAEVAAVGVMPRESFSFLSNVQTFGGDFSLGPKGAAVSLADYLKLYCKPNNNGANRRYTVDADGKSCQTLLGQLTTEPTAPAATQLTLLVGNWNGVDDVTGKTVNIGDWRVTTPDGKQVGWVHVQAGHEFWFVAGGTANGGYLAVDTTLHTFTQQAAAASTLKASVQWKGFVQKVCPDAATVGTYYDVTAVSRACL